MLQKVEFHNPAQLFVIPHRAPSPVRACPVLPKPRAKPRGKPKGTRCWRCSCGADTPIRCLWLCSWSWIEGLSTAASSTVEERRFSAAQSLWVAQRFQHCEKSPPRWTRASAPECLRRIAPLRKRVSRKGHCWSDFPKANFRITDKPGLGSGKAARRRTRGI